MLNVGTCPPQSPRPLQNENALACKVVIHDYSLHIPPDSLVMKMGNLVIRRSVNGQKVLTFLMRSLQILKLTNTIISDILAHECIRMPKNSSKAAKIRKLMSLDIVKKTVNSEQLENLEAALKEQEKNRNKKKGHEDPFKEEEASDNEDGQ